MDQAGLRCMSTHHPLDVLRAKLDELIEYGHALGLDYIVCPCAASHRDPAAKGPTDPGRLALRADEFNSIGEKVKAAGMTFGYHNHDAEFGIEDGVVFYDELLQAHRSQARRLRDGLRMGGRRPGAIRWSI